MGQANQISPELLDPLLSIVGPMAQRFNDAGYRLYLVGGIVRDLLIAGSSPSPSLGDSHDIDLTTDAEPMAIKQLAAPGADAVWTQGERFGTIGIRLGQHDLEITTHRAEAYDPSSRKPVVSFGRDLHQDLSRRDFTINAIAIDTSDGAIADPFDGAADLFASVLRTPLEPEVSFGDDPLRMLRAARFIARFKLSANPSLVAAATELASRLQIVSVERQAVELERLLALPQPAPGFEFLKETSLLAELITELRTLDPLAADLACRLAAVPGSTVVRRVGLVWPTRSITTLKRLRYSNTDQKTTRAIVTALDQALGSDSASAFDFAAARRIVAAIGVESVPTMEQAAEAIGRHDPAISQQAAARVKAIFDDLAANENLADLGSPLNGTQIIAVLGVEPGPQVGQAERFLREYRFDNGPITPDEAKELLRAEFHSSEK